MLSWNKMNEDALISVIIPVYNVRPYLERCFQSVTNQSYHNLEIILVDDGSTDGSSELCDELAARDHRARVIHKQNGGSGSAKNAGINEAAGEYISLVDSDDWITADMYYYMLQILQKTGAQIAVCGIQKVNEYEEISYYNDDLEERVILNTEQALYELPRNEKITNSMCNKLFQANILKGLKMNETVSYDDVSFVPQCIARARTIAYTAEPYYCYFEREGSISKSSFTVKEFDRVTADRMRLEFYHKEFPQCEESAAIAFIGTCLKVYYESRQSVEPEARENRSLLRRELRETINKYKGLPFTRKQKAKARLFLMSPWLFEISMKFRGK